MGRYFFSKKAENDLIDIYSYGFLNHGERQANAYMDALKQKCQFLSDNPLFCRERGEFTLPVRLYHHKKHLIIYTVDTDQIVIVRVLHERMNVEEWLET